MLFRKHKKISAETLIDLKRYIDSQFPGEAARDECTPQAASCCTPQAAREKFAGAAKRRSTQETAALDFGAVPNDLHEALETIDESFSEMLLRKIDERHMTDAQCYKKAQIDRKLFSKIRSQRDYRPSKQTAISFALALELSLDETRDLLMKAGYALSRSSKADIIVEYFILHGIFDKFLVNEALYEFDQTLL